MIQGAFKFTGIAIGEVSINVMGTNLKMEAKAAFVDTKTGATHGWTTGNQWSPATVLKMKELLSAMEEDLSRQHFENGTFTESPAGTARPSLGGGGLGEHVAGDGESV